MGTKGRYTIRILAGGYLFYLGLNLIRDVIKEGGSGKILFIFAGAAFVLFGIWIMFDSYKHVKEENRKEKEEAAECVGEDLSENAGEEVVEPDEEGSSEEEPEEYSVNPETADALKRLQERSALKK